MTKYRVADLEGAMLDAAVAMAHGHTVRLLDERGRTAYWQIKGDRNVPWYAVPGYSTEWAYGGPIIERERIKLEPWPYDDTWQANGVWGPTPLVAAMRAFVTSKLGDEVDL